MNFTKIVLMPILYVIKIQPSIDAAITITHTQKKMTEMGLHYSLTEQSEISS